jgi:pimeloyl-ACP methyl ester carboxylesterase
VATFCLIHGKWHDSSCWAPLAERLRASGHDVLAPDLPLDDPQTTYQERVRPALDALAAVTGPVSVVGHSLGAGYAPLVAAAVTDASLVYLCPAPVGPFADGASPVREYREGFSFPPNRPDRTSVWEPQAAVEAMYPRLEPEVARSLAYRLVPGASPADRYPLGSQPEVPTTFVYASHDEFFEPAWSAWAAREIAGVQPILIETGHFPMIEAPDDLARILLELVDGAQTR